MNLQTAEPLKDKALFSWIEAGMRPDARGGTYLFSLVPDCFEAYVRILHPAYQLGSDTPVSWREIAAEVGTHLHPEAQYEAIAGNLLRWQDPTLGQLPEAEGRELARVLARFTSTQRIYFGIWEGYPLMRPMLDQAVSVSLPGRVYGLFGGTFDTVLALMEERKFLNGPNLWWPEDRTWFCASDIDEVSSYVGGSRDCIKEIQASDLETFEVRIDARIGPRADTL